MWRTALELSLCYAAWGALWIIVSDRLVAHCFHTPAAITAAQTYKGWTYVVATGVLCFILIRAGMFRVQALEARMHQQNKLESLGMLAAGVAHEINNPLTVVMTNAELVKSVGSTDLTIQTSIDYIIAATVRAAEIVRSLQTFARRQTPDQRDAISLHELVRDTLVLTQMLWQRDRIEVRTTVAATLPAVRCNRAHIQQVVLNLLSNARDALCERSIAANHKTIVISACELRGRAGDWLRLSVTDNGAGIPAAILAHVCDPFFTTKSRNDATGLGLAIAYGIIKDHHGRLSFDSEPGRGTSVHVDLPLSAAPPAAG